jgi:hypothetical protein
VSDGSEKASLLIFVLLKVGLEAFWKDVLYRALYDIVGWSLGLLERGCGLVRRERSEPFCISIALLSETFFSETF